MLDLNTVDYRAMAEAGKEIEIIDSGTKKGTGAFITILGADSCQWQSVNDEIHSTYELSGGSVKQKHWKEKNKDSAKILASVTTSWRGLCDGDNELDFTYENALKLYEQYPFIANQVYSAINDRNLFLVSA